MTCVPEAVMSRVRRVVGTRGVERLDSAGVRLLLRKLLFDGGAVPEWHDRAACRWADPELFFPGPSSKTETNAAIRVCARCPVLAQCRADVMAWEQPAHRYGIAGGLAADERRWIAQHRKDGDR